MKKCAEGIAIVVAFSLASAGCGIGRAVDNANVVLENAADLLGQIDAKLESGEINRETAALLDQRIRNLMDQLNTAIQQNGGQLIDLAGGALEEQVAAILEQLEQIQAGIADPAKGALLDQLSEQLELQTNALGAQIGDVVSLSFGKANVLLDRTTQSVVIVISLILLGVGVVVFAVVLFKKGGIPLRGAGLLGTIFAVGYVLFFLSMVVVRPVRAFVLATIGVGAEVEQADLAPRIRGVVPQAVTLGKDPNQVITLYGWNLNRIGKADVRLYESEGQNRNTPTFSFPAKTIIVATPTRIVLGNFDKELGWKAPDFETVRKRVLGGVISGPRMAAYLRMSRSVNELMFPGRTARAAPSPAAMPIGPPHAVHGPATTTATLLASFVRPKLVPEQLRARIFEIARAEFESVDAESPAPALDGLYQNTFGIPAGRFAVRVYDGDKEVEGAQFVDMRYPPPPPPSPDISPIAIAWPAGPVAEGDAAKLRVRLGFVHPEAITHAFRVRLTSSTMFQGTRWLEVSLGQVQTALRSNFLDVDDPLTFRAPKSGVHSATVEADDRGTVEESDETNNRFTTDVTVRPVAYDATVTFRAFQAKHNYDDSTDEYRVNVLVQVPGFSDWKFPISKDGEPGKPYALRQAREYRNLQPSSIIAIRTSGYEADDPDPDDYMGSANENVCLEPDCAGADPMTQSERNVIVSCGGYQLSVVVKITRRVL